MLKGDVTTTSSMLFISHILRVKREKMLYLANLMDAYLVIFMYVRFNVLFIFCSYEWCFNYLSDSILIWYISLICSFTYYCIDFFCHSQNILINIMVFFFKIFIHMSPWYLPVLFLFIQECVRLMGLWFSFLLWWWTEYLRYISLYNLSGSV